MKNKYTRGISFYVLGAIIVGLFLSFLVFFIDIRWEVKQHKEEFERLAEDRIHLFRVRLDDHFETLYSVASFFDSSEAVNRKEFKLFANNIFKFRDSITFLFWIPAVKGKDRLSFEQSVRKDISSDFEILELYPDGSINRSREKPHYYPVTFIEAIDNNLTPFGIDFLSEPVRAAALEMARDTGSSAITGRTKRIGVETENYSCLIFYPLYRKGALLNSSIQRRDNLLGFLALVFEVKKTLENSLAGLSRAGINVGIYDQSALPDESLLYHYETLPDKPVSLSPIVLFAKSLDKFSIESEFDVAGRKWKIVAEANPLFFSQWNFWQAWLILICGLLLTALSAEVMFIIIRRAEKIELMVLQRTDELASANKLLEKEIIERKAAQVQAFQATQKWENTFDAISDLVFIQNKDFIIIKVNQAMCKALGLKPEDIEGKKCHEVMHKTGSPWMNCPFKKTLQDQQPHTEEVDDAHLGMPLLITTSPIFDEKGELTGSVHIAKDISVLKKIQEELKDSEEKFRALYESSGDALMLLDEKGVFFDCNKRTLEIFGIKDVKEFINTSPAVFSPALQPDGQDSDSASKAHIKKAFETGHDDFNWVHKRKDGPDFNAEVLLTALKYKGKDIIQATVRDISEQVRMAEALRKQKDEQQIILDSVPAMVFFKDKENRFIRTNKALEDAVGMPKDKVEGKSCFDLYSLEEAQRYWKDDLEIIKTGKPKFGIIETMKSVKGELWVQTDKIPFRDTQGNVIGIIGFSLDITQRKHAEEALIKSREEIVSDKLKMESMVVSMAEGVIMLDESDKIVIINPQARWMLGFGFNEEIDSNTLLNRLKALKLDNAYQECITSRRFISQEATNYQGHFLRCELTPVKNAAKVAIGTVVILRDITKEKEIDALKSEFVSTVSHELRTPLSITKEGVSLVLDGIPGKINPQQRKILLTSRDNMDRLARIINNLLDISKIESGKIELKREPVDINELARKTAANFELRLGEKGLGLKLKLPDKPIIAYVDPDKIVQVLTNLIGNAYKFTQKGGIEISCSEKEDRIECSVSDTGAGISADDLPRVFEKFQQFSRIDGAGEKGTGLGLSIAKALVELHKGQMKVESSLGKGSVFSFYLPKYSSAELFKDTVKQGMSEALKKNLKMSVLMVSLDDFNRLRKEIPETEVRGMLKALEQIIKSALRREGDMVIRDTGEIIIVLIDCSKDDVLRVEGRIEQALIDYLAQKGLKDKIKLHMGASSYPDDARNEDELIKKAKA